MGRVRSSAAVLPALLPGALVVLLAFQSGGYSPSSWAPIAGLGMIALALRVTTIGRPFAGVSPWSAVAMGAFALFGAWTLLSAEWSHAPGRALVEFGRLLAYLTVFLVCASLAPREHRAQWAVRGVAIAIGVVCIAALLSRLRPDLVSAEGLVPARLDYPLTYWNALGVLAGVGVVLGFHLSASSEEPRVVRVLAAALPPIAAVTVYFTLSRGGVAATGVGLFVYLLLGFSRATPGALLALVPPCAVVLQRAYDARLLVEPDFASAAGMVEGREIARALGVAVAVAVGLRALALLLDHVLAFVPSPARLPIAVRVGLVVVAVGLVTGVAVARGAPAWADRQVDSFLSSSPAPVPGDVRDRLLQVNSNGRVGHWRVALDAWEREPLHGTGAGTYQNTWNQHRDVSFQVLDAHSLYLEVLSEFGVVGLALLLIALGAIIAGPLWRLRGPGRPTYAATLAAVVAWCVHAGVDWDWEMAAVTIWVFGLAGLVLARPRPQEATAPAMPKLVRLLVALGCLGLALSPLALWRSQERLQASYAAFQKGDCATTIDAALDSLAAVGARAEPWELIAYCDVRLGQRQLAVGAAQAAVRRDPGDWEYHYALALVKGAVGQDPRADAAAARRLNPIQVEPKIAVRAFKTDKPAVWERRARRLRLYLR